MLSAPAVRQRSSGNTLAEYGLACALLIGAVAFAVAQNDWPYQLSALQGKLINGRLLSSSGTLTVPPLGTPIRNEPVRPPLANQKICFASGNCVNLPVIPAGASVTDTTGGLGGELAVHFSDVLSQIAQELDDANADPIVRQLVTDLANAGHVIGTGLTKYDDIVAKYDCDIRACTSDNVPFDELNVLRDRGAFVRNALYNQEMTLKYQILKSYLASHPAALAGFPEAAAIIKLEYEQIGRIISTNEAICSTGTDSCALQMEVKTLPLVPSVRTYTNPQTGEAITETSYSANGLMYYRSVDMNGIKTTYQATSSGMELFTDEIPQSVPFGFFLGITGSIPPQSTQNNATLVHQDSNVICGSGGDTNHCIVNPNL